jgi:hypothetical protein
MPNPMALISSKDGEVEDPYTHFVLRYSRLLAETVHEANNQPFQKEDIFIWLA